MTERTGETAEEVARIKEVYSRRTDGGLYSPLRAGQLFMLQEKERRLATVLAASGETPLDELRVLDVGCGGGFWLRKLLEFGAQPSHLTGVDILPGRLQSARNRTASGVGFATASATDLPFRSGGFDIVMQYTVFSSILDHSIRCRVASEILRVVRPGGRVLWYDFRVNNPRNPDVRGMSSAMIHELFPSCRIQLHSVTPAPPLVRALAGRSWLLTAVLSRLPFLRTHWFAVIRPAQARA